MHPGRASNGLALTTILLTVVLLAAIAVTIAMSSRSGSGSSSQQQDKLLAANIMAQAQQFRTSIELAMSNGLDISTITASHSSPVTYFSPAAAGIISMVAPLQANARPGTGMWWSWHGAGQLA